jgi:long-subunit fatty acid transport protein
VQVNYSTKIKKMRKAVLIIIAATLTFSMARGQNVDDALRYSQVFYNGTARFMGMGGAFTALGADLSAISLNPAGTGLYRSSEVSITPQLNYVNTSSIFSNNSSSDFSYRFGLSQAGVVTNILSNGNKTGLITLNVAYSYNMTNNFNKRAVITGFSDNSSMADYWVSQANGYAKSELPSTPWVASETYIIDYLPGSTDLYGTVFSQYGDSAYATYGQNIRRLIENNGYMGEHSFSIGGNYSNNLFFGMSLGIHSIRYTGHMEHLESDVDNVIYDFKSFNYIDNLNATGTGVSLKIGTIYLPVEYLKIGLSVHSPVIYRIEERYSDNISSAFDTEVDGVSRYESTDKASYRYTFTSPFRLNAGVALQIKKLALISADYEFVDYRISRFSNASDNLNYYEENRSIKEILKPASNLRLGTEFRLNSLYLRGGYSYYGKGYNVDDDPQVQQDKGLDYNAISVGVGFRQPGFFFDLAFTGSFNKSNYYMYYDPPYLSPANLETTKNSFMATVGFKF